MRDLPFIELIEKVKYRRGEFRTEVILFDNVIGVAENRAIESPEGKTAWENEIRCCVASISTTIKLETLCRCTRMMEVPRSQREVIVPLPSHLPTITVEATPFPDIEVIRKREFQYRGKHDENGFRLFTERAQR